MVGCTIGSREMVPLGVRGGVKAGLTSGGGCLCADVGFGWCIADGGVEGELPTEAVEPSPLATPSVCKSNSDMAWLG